MARLFDRKVKAIIIPENGISVSVEGLRMSFQCEKTVEETPNTLRLEIYNMNKLNRSLLEADKTRISLEAGYKDTSSLIFIGNIERVVHEKDGPDIISKLECKDGGNRYRNARIERSYGPGVRSNFVIADMAAEFGLRLGQFVDIPATQYAQGLSVSGLIRDELTNVTRKSGLEWSVQDETLQIIPKGKSTNDGIVLLNFESGLINRPTKTKKGVNFTSLLQPELRPGKAVKIESDSQEIDGMYKLKKVVHQGDSRQGLFQSICEAKLLRRT